MSGDEPRYQPVSRPFIKRFDYVYSVHVFQKLPRWRRGHRGAPRFAGAGTGDRSSPRMGSAVHLVVAVDSGQQEAARHRIRASTRRVGRRVQAKEGWVMSCAVCGNGERVPATKPYVEEKDGRIAVVTGVPVTVCESCGETWLDAPVAHALDALLTEMLSHDTLGVRAFAASTAA